MSEPITIRPAGAHDVPAIQRIYNREILEGVATLDEWPWTDARRREWLETYRDEMVIVAEGDATVIGFAYLSPMQKFGFRFTREVTVYIDPDHHRTGVGRQLVEALIEGAHERRLHVLIARITSENAASLALFESLGFERTALRRQFGYKFGRWHDIVETQLTLQSPEEFEALVTPGFRVSVVTTPEEMEEALSVRRAVFIDEQRIDEDEEIDRYDADPATVTDAVHVLGRLDGRPVATARLLLDMAGPGAGIPRGADGQSSEDAGIPGRFPHIGRVAVLQSERGRYWGVGVMEALHDEARRRGYAGCTLAAQEYAVGFYAKLGYVARGEVFLDAGIEHRWMDLVFEETEGGTT
ncbi:MAG: GNAT family N-acetyltransferase [Chloroflexi bacterium]|nr:GNAT family N-acetyltransferase [Chloroflexota bacterium]